MGCTNCGCGSTKTEDGKHPGCRSNGNCGTGGCSAKLSTFNWLSGMHSPDAASSYDICEIRFKNGRKAFYRNLHDYQVQIGDVVVVDCSPGFDVGIVSAEGELARIQAEKKGQAAKKFELKKIIRKATQEDIEVWQKAREKEEPTMFRAREMAKELALVMKISDVELQADGAKATFYYTADERVDFRELIRHLAEEFKTRVEMRQIGARQEASRLGGIGSCGRELCCSTWLTDFRTVSTSAARYQQLSLNPQKLAGQCGKLKCCLNYELDMYQEAMRDFPDTNIKLKSKDGFASHFKTDIFKRVIWYLVPSQNGVVPIPLQVDRVQEIIQLNKNGKTPENFRDFAVVETAVEEEPDYDNVVGQDSLTRFDTKNKKRRKSRSRKPSDASGKNTKSKSRKTSSENRRSADGDRSKKQSKEGAKKGERQGEKRREANSGQRRARNKNAGAQSGEKRSENKSNTRRRPSGKRRNDASKKDE